MKTLQLNTSDARRLYPTASPEFKAMLEANFTTTELSGPITDRIKTYEDACAELGEAPINEADMRRNGFTDDEIALRKLKTITKALNEGMVMAWSDCDQKKWVPWFDTSSGFAFSDSAYGYSNAYAGIASRLCFKNSDLAAYAGRQFTDLYKAFIL